MVARTSLKYRNPDNATDAWERKVLEQFEARKANGEDPKQITHTEVVEDGGKKTFRFMKAIPTGPVCRAFFILYTVSRAALPVGMRQRPPPHRLIAQACIH